MNLMLFVLYIFSVMSALVGLGSLPSLAIQEVFWTCLEDLIRVNSNSHPDFLQVLPLQSSDAEHVARLGSPLLLVAASELSLGLRFTCFLVMLMSSTIEYNIWVPGSVEISIETKTYVAVDISTQTGQT